MNPYAPSINRIFAICMSVFILSGGGCRGRHAPASSPASQPATATQAAQPAPPTIPAKLSVTQGWSQQFLIALAQRLSQGWFIPYALTDAPMCPAGLSAHPGVLFMAVRKLDRNYQSFSWKESPRIDIWLMPSSYVPREYGEPSRRAKGLRQWRGLGVFVLTENIETSLDVPALLNAALGAVDAGAAAPDGVTTAIGAARLEQVKTKTPGGDSEVTGQLKGSIKDDQTGHYVPIHVSVDQTLGKLFWWKILDRRGRDDEAVPVETMAVFRGESLGDDNASLLIPRAAMFGGGRDDKQWGLPLTQALSEVLRGGQKVPPEMIERATVIAVGTGKHYNGPCISGPDGSLAMPINNAFDIQRVLRGNTSLKSISFRTSAPTAPAGQIVEGRKYLLFLAPGPLDYWAMMSETDPVMGGQGAFEVLGVLGVDH
ncbi:MAG: hypothetical protein ABFD92_08110 [Planctomycetaceae bacterium]|nr:hypothetical protein [Planctomycetaceae bacterium]